MIFHRAQRITTVGFSSKWNGVICWLVQINSPDESSLISGGNTDDCATVSNPDIDYAAAGVGKGNDILPDAFCIVQFQFDCLAFQEVGECLFVLSHPSRPISSHLASHILIILIVTIILSVSLVQGSSTGIYICRHGGET